MADVRSLLRQQRAARRIEHSHAAYSDAGKLLCTLCHEQLKAESMWDGHLRSAGHKASLQKLQQPTLATSKANGQGEEGRGGSQQKRKHNDEDENDDEVMEDAMRRKRNRADMSAHDDDKEDKDQNRTPPQTARRTSATPSQGVEMQMASRPATPARRDGSSSSTPGASGAVVASHSTTTLPSRQASNLAADIEANRLNTTAQQVDESEWAAFEADIAAVSAPYSEDAVISAPAMTAEEAEAATKAEEEAAEKRRAQADKDIEAEKEEATWQLEEEFDEMEELEARVKRLKEKREALRKLHEGGGQGDGDTKTEKMGKENQTTFPENGHENEDDEDDEDDDDDPDSFWIK